MRSSRAAESTAAKVVMGVEFLGLSGQEVLYLVPEPGPVDAGFSVVLFPLKSGIRPPVVTARVVVVVAVASVAC
jgi:hypothetical protein